MTDKERRDRERHWGGMVIVSYRDDSDSEGRVIWDGEAEMLGIPHATVWPPRKTPPTKARKP